MRCRRYCHTALHIRRCHTLINCYFDGAYTSVTSHPAYLHDYGQILRVFDLDLPAVVEAHFSLEESGKSILRMGACEKGITHIPIPDSCLEETGSFYCYIFDRDSTSGKTVYKIKIPVLKRADMPTETTEPSEQDVSYFEQVLAQMTAQTDRILNGLSIGTVETLGAGENATASITTDGDTFSLNLGIPQGERGEDGEDGKDGAGGGVGESTAGQSVTYNNTDYTCGTGAERFSDYASNLAIGQYSHAEGSFTKSIGNFSHAEGLGGEATHQSTHAEGVGTKATQQGAHSEGSGSIASGACAHAEGSNTKSQGNATHSEGAHATASGDASHAEGGNTTSSGIYAHAEGSSTTASGASSHAEGTGARASGDSAHAEGYYTYASSNNQHAQGRYNIVDSQGKYIDIVGNGNADSDRSNAETTDWTGVKWLKKDVRCGGSNQDDPNAVSMITLANKISALEARVSALEGGN